MAERFLRSVGYAKKADSDEPTALERAALLTAIDDLLADGYADAVYDSSAELVELAWKNARALLGIQTGLDVVPQWALDALRKRADDFQFLVEEREREVLRKVLDDALTSGASHEAIGKTIRATFAAGYHRLNAAGEVVLIAPTRSWSETVARTELATAATSGAMALYREAGLKTVRWQCADPCPECAEHDDQVFGLDDVPEGGPPLHPNCVCALVPADEDLGNFRGSDAEREAATRGNAEG